MARTRYLKPGFFKNELLAEIDPLGRLLFAGLWTIADREGRLEDRPKRIKAEILPYDDCNVDELLDSLHKKGFILRYEVEGERYIQILNFSKHQNPHPREAKSVIPAPHEDDNAKSLPRQNLGSDKAMPRQDQGKAKDMTSSALTLTLTSTCTSTSTHMPRSASVSPAQLSPDYPPEFEEFWRAYPEGRRKEKKAAYRAWKARLNAGAKPEQLITAATLYAQECKGKDPRYIKLPKTFLGPDDHWLEYQQPRGDPGGEPQYTHVHPLADLRKAIQRKTMVGIEGGEP